MRTILSAILFLCLGACSLTRTAPACHGQLRPINIQTAGQRDEHR